MSGSTTISFDEIPYEIARPSTQIEVRADYTNVGLASYPARILLMGQMQAGFAGGSGGPYLITRQDEGYSLFGYSSMLSRMCERALAASPSIPIYALGSLPATGAVAATGTLTVVGGANGLVTAAAVPFYVGGRLIQVIVRPTETVLVQAANIAAAINADTYCPLSASVAGAVVTLTAKDAGEAGNGLRVRIGLRGDDQTPPGTWSCSIVQPAGGAGTPDITPLLTKIAAEWFTDIAVGWSDATTLGVLSAELDARYVATGRKDALAYVGMSASLGSALAGATALNSKFIARLPVFTALSPPWEWAASLCAVAAQALANDPSRQLRSLALPGILPPAPKDRYLDSDREQLIRYGYSTFTVTAEGTVVLERVVSCYQYTSLGVADKAWRDIMVARTMSRIRHDWASYLGLVYPRHKLADDDTQAAQFSDIVATPRRLQNSWAARCKLYERQGWIEQAQRTSTKAVFARDPNDPNRVNSKQTVRVIGNLMVFAGRLTFEA